MDNEIGNFYSLLGPSRLFSEFPREQVIKGADFSWTAYRKETFAPEKRFERIAIRTPILATFGVDNFSDIPGLFSDPESTNVAYTNLIEKWTNLYGIEGNFNSREAMVYRAMDIADSVITDLRSGMLAGMRHDISIAAEIENERNPLNLMRMAVSPENTQRMQYEARRKLILGHVALSALKAREDRGSEVGDFLQFLDDHVWRGTETGIIKKITVVTRHSQEDFKCENVKIIGPEEEYTLQDNEVFHPFAMRPWLNKRGTERYAYLEGRDKDIEKIVLKMFRLGTINAQSIEDRNGLQLVFPDETQIDEFVTVLLSTLVEEENVAAIPFDMTNTIENETAYRGTSDGASRDLEIRRMKIPFRGEVFELQFQTFRTYADYWLRDGVAHDEYEVGRFFHSSNTKETPITAQLLFPEDIYGFDILEYEDQIIERMRQMKRL